MSVQNRTVAFLLVAGLLSGAGLGKGFAAGQDGVSLAQVERVQVLDFRFEGNRTILDEELAALVESSRGQSLTVEQLFALAQVLTRHYVEQGYVNSGARLPDQEIRDGVVTFEITEGRVAELRATGLERLDPAWLSKRLLAGMNSEEGQALQLQRLRDNLQLLEQDPLIERIQADLQPGLLPGEALLQADVTEASPWQLLAGLDNHRAPSIGSLRGWLELAHLNITGHGDALKTRFALTEGLDDYYLRYETPVGTSDWTLRLQWERGDSVVVEEPFVGIDYTSETERVLVGIEYPWLRQLDQQVMIGVALSHQRNATEIDGKPFAVSDEPAETRITGLNFNQTWIQRSQWDVVASYTALELGMPWLDATRLPGELPDGRYVAWHGQLQWVRRHAWRNSESLLRVEMRLSDERQLPGNRFAIGGANTVRGYRENSLLRDAGFIASLEWRIPIHQGENPGGQSLVQLAPFVDYGRGWNRDDAAYAPASIASAGLGLRMRQEWGQRHKLEARLYWAHPFDDVTGGAEYDLQDDGIHFEFRLQMQ